LKKPASHKVPLLLIAMIAFCCVLSCRRTQESYTAAEKLLKVKNDSALKWNSESKTIEANLLLDSLFSNRENLTPYEKYLYYSDRCIIEGQHKRYESWNSYADSAISILEKNNGENRYPSEYIISLLTKGDALYALTDYKDAYDYYYKAKVISEEKPRFQVKSTYIYSIAMDLYKQGLYREAAHYFKLDLDNLATPDPGYIYRAQELLNNIGLCYGKVHMHDSALYFYDSAMNFIHLHSAGFGTKIPYEKAIGVVTGNIATIYLDKNSLDTAERLLKASVQINMQPHHENDDAQKTLLKLAELYYRKNEMDSMYKTMLLLQKTLDTIKNDDVRAGLEKLNYLYYGKKGDELKSLKSFQNYINERDSMNLMGSASERGSILNEVNNKEQQNQILHLEKDKETDKMALMVTVFIALAIIVSGIFLLFNYRKISSLHKKVSAQKVELESSGREKEILLKEVHHRVKNNLQVISSLLELQLHRVSDENARTALSESQARVMSMAIIHQKLYQDEMLDSLLFRAFADDLFLQIKSISGNTPESVQLVNELPDRYFEIDIAVPLGLILNELITNSFKYARASSGALSIILRLIKKDEYDVLEYRDNGQGMPAGTSLENNHSMGLQLVRRLSNQLGGHAEYTFDKGSVFSVYFLDN